jgi:hypothetical protein
MRLELQQIGAILVALLLGGSISLSLFLAMIFLIEPERATNSHMTRPYVVTFVAVEHKNKTKKNQDKSIAMPKLSSSPELPPTRANAPKKVMRKNIDMHLPSIGPVNFYSVGQGNTLDLNIDSEENYYPKGNGKVLFNQVERKYLLSKKGGSHTPERFRLIGGGEIDRIGNTCFAAPGVSGSGSSNTGQTAIEKDFNQSLALSSLTAHQVSCNKTNSSLAQYFLKQLKKRGLIMAPVSVTN